MTILVKCDDCGKMVECGEKLVIGVNWYDSSKSKCVYICNRCIIDKYRDYRKEYYKKNKDKYIELNKIWRKNNKEKYYEYLKEYKRNESELFKKEVSEEDKLFIKSHMIDRDELYNKIMKQIKNE